MKNSESRSHHPLFIVGETIDGRISTGTKSLGQQALNLSRRLDCLAVAVLLGDRIGKAADQWSRTTGTARNRAGKTVNAATPTRI